MAYVGNTPSRGQWRKLTDISGSFNGVTTTFTTSVPPGTSDYYVTAGSASQLIISVGGVIQEPDVDYTVSTYSITFTTAPAAGLSFFGVLCGDALNVGTPGDGSVTTAKLGSNLTVDLASGTAASPSLTFDSNTGLYSPGEDQVGITTGGTGRMFIDSSGRLLVGTSTARSNIFSSGGAVTPTLQLENNTNTWSNGLSILNYSGSQFGSSLALGMSASNTPGTNALVTTGQLCGRFHFLANDGTNFYPIAEIGGWTDGTTGTGDVPGRLTFSTTADGASSPIERLRIDSTGLVTLAGPGIKFPATQVASADANVLDDYEEGTWTPSAANLTINSGSVTYTARYIKIGRQVTVWLTATGANVTATNSTTFSGLPFVPQSDYGVGLLYDYGATGKKAVAQAYNDSKIYLNAISADLANMTALALTVSYTVS